ncbi:DUF397 domain-containing protein [Actinorugispora endophytica]|uniref:Uncharacterized protein DUF397 n=1 Tax=Actinorugispora endophytica TaxID=1605990 RepID=A0A4V3D958_9ACTN|nr:DUF397 domain-containing protein [Actinorugispora endophytica]TDQ54780.1 uncharacterized protein DUF397 [Actinorugispora endophytica]
METPLNWKKSSYSSGRGENCVEVALPWHKSSYSQGDSENCVEVASYSLCTAVRDSKHPGAGHLAFSASEWAAFVAGLKHTP